MEKDRVRSTIAPLVKGDHNLRLLMLWGAKVETEKLASLGDDQVDEAVDIVLARVNAGCGTNLKRPDVMAGTIEAGARRVIREKAALLEQNIQRRVARR